MGREVKRVALDFDWPVGELWHGYVNPHYKECRANCQGGYSPLYKAIEPILRELVRVGGTRSKAPVEDAEQFISALTERERDPLFGSFLNGEWVIAEKLFTLAGMDPDTATECKVCHGSGIDPDVKEAYEAWERFDPPAGEGWQLWSTTTEGHPMTPVFTTADELARYCADEKVSSFGDETQTYLQWLEFFEGPGWAPSAVMDSHGFRSGVAAVVGA